VKKGVDFGLTQERAHFLVGEFCPSSEPLHQSARPWDSLGFFQAVKMHKHRLAERAGQRRRQAAESRCTSKYVRATKPPFARRMEWRPAEGKIISRRDLPSARCRAIGTTTGR